MRRGEEGDKGKKESEILSQEIRTSKIYNNIYPNWRQQQQVKNQPWLFTT